MTYEESVRYLLTLGRELAAPSHARAQKFDLGNITILCERLGNPHRAAPCVHIAGTNGKGSTAAMVDSILRAAGLRTGLYTSPHLERINERIRINGENISDADFAATFDRVLAVIEELLASGALSAHPTYFECLTAMAFDFYSRARTDFSIFEVGMGGRLDSTNIVTPEVAVISQIDFDHENFLGHSIAEIAAEKAGIIKPGIPVISAAEHPAARDVVARRAAALQSPLIEIDTAWRLDDIHSENGCFHARATASDSSFTVELAARLPGSFQLRNALTACTAARLLTQRGFAIADSAIGHGIASAVWPGRLELLQQHPAVYLDGTHNPAGARELLRFWQEEYPDRRIILVYGAMRDKAVDEIAGLLFPHAAAVILTQPRQPRAISAGELARLTGHLAADLQIIPVPEEAVEEALDLASPSDVVCITGSLYLVGDIRRWWNLRSLASDQTSLPVVNRNLP